MSINVVSTITNYVYCVEKSNESAIVVDSLHAVTFRNGVHSEMMINDEIALKNVRDPSESVEVTVIASHSEYNCIVFKMNNGEFPNFPSGCSSVTLEMKYTILGFEKDTNQVSVENGVVKEMQNNGFVGSTLSRPGSAAFDEFGRILGIVNGNNCDGRCLIIPSYVIRVLYGDRPNYSW